jgi:hypothetical protein
MRIPHLRIPGRHQSRARSETIGDQRVVRLPAGGNGCGLAPRLSWSVEGDRRGNIASIYHHPIHPMLIVLPLGQGSSPSLLPDLPASSAGGTRWPCMMAGGIVGGAAAIPGDRLSTLPVEGADYRAFMISNVVALTISSLRLPWLCLDQTASCRSCWPGLAVATGGWLGRCVRARRRRRATAKTGGRVPARIRPAGTPSGGKE